MNILIEKLLANLFSLFNNQVFHLGKTSVSLGSIFTFIFWTLVVIAISRILRKWLNKRLLVKLGLDAGVREAIATIASYSTAIFGLVIVMHNAGINMNSVHFLAGGLGIGIGLGLQELAKNFISGLTLLFEQQIKIGDRIIVDGQEGIIERIAIRSTVIRKNDGIYVIIPNLKLVVDKIINISLGDSKRRISLPFIVDSDSDPVLVTEILLNAAYQETMVLTEPSPQVRLKDFHLDGLNFELLVWIDKTTTVGGIISNLNFIIQYKFRYRGIKTASPQRELSWRNIEELKCIIGGDRAFIANASIQAQLNNKTFYSKNNTANVPIESLSYLLRKVTYFEKFSDLDMLRLIEKGYRQILPPHQFIFRENDPGDSFHIILSGAVEVLSEKANKHIRNLAAGDFFGELALIMGIPRSASVRTLAETTLFVVTRSGFQQLLSSYPDLAEQIAEKLAERQEELLHRQQLLHEMGLLDETDLEVNIIDWIRQRMHELFGIYSRERGTGNREQE